MEWIEQDGGGSGEHIFLGDVVERGHASREVVSLVSAEGQARDNWQCVKGNHDRMFTRYLEEGRVDDPRMNSKFTWLHPRLGGVDTLKSYGVVGASEKPSAAMLAEARAQVPAAHKTFLTDLPLYVEREDVLFVHAGIRPGVPLAEQDPEDMIWIRNSFLMEPAPHPWLVVHGHTAIDMPHHYGNRVNLDGGAGYGNPIYPAVFEGRDCWLLDDKGRLPLVP